MLTNFPSRSIQRRLQPTQAKLAAQPNLSETRTCHKARISICSLSMGDHHEDDQAAANEYQDNENEDDWDAMFEVEQQESEEPTDNNSG